MPVVHTQIIGHYNLNNCLAAACIGNYFKVSDAEIKEALENYVPDMNRSQLVKTTNNTLILDAYNANPNSMRAAIDNFAKYPAEKKLLLLGDMFELGSYAALEHKEIVNLLQAHGFAEVLLVGKEFCALKDVSFDRFESTSECLAALKNKALKGYTVLIKGSRSMKMETLQEAL